MSTKLLRLTLLLQVVSFLILKCAFIYLGKDIFIDTCKVKTSSFKIQIYLSVKFSNEIKNFTLKKSLLFFVSPLLTLCVILCVILLSNLKNVTAFNT